MAEARPSDLLKAWRAGRFGCAYYLVGEASATRELLSKLKDAVKADAFNFAEYASDAEARAAEIVADALTAPVFGERRLIVVTQPKLSAAARAVFAGYLEAPLETTTIVFFSDEKKPDPKDPLAQAAAKLGGLTVCGPLREEEALAKLAAEAQAAGKTLELEAAQALVAEAGTDWGVLRQELEKALLFSGSAARVTAAHVLECLGYQKALDPFALPRLIQKRALREVLAHLRRLFDAGKPAEAAFSALAQISGAVSKQFRAQKMLAGGSPQDEIFRALRLNAYYDREYLSWVARLGQRRLLRDLELCLETETRLKSQAWLDPRVELEQLAVGLCQARGAAAGAAV